MCICGWNRMGFRSPTSILGRSPLGPLGQDLAKTVPPRRNLATENHGFPRGSQGFHCSCWSRGRFQVSCPWNISPPQVRCGFTVWVARGSPLWILWSLPRKKSQWRDWLWKSWWHVETWQSNVTWMRRGNEKSIIYRWFSHVFPVKPPSIYGGISHCTVWL